MSDYRTLEQQFTLLPTLLDRARSDIHELRDRGLDEIADLFEGLGYSCAGCDRRSQLICRVAAQAAEIAYPINQRLGRHCPAAIRVIQVIYRMNLLIFDRPDREHGTAVTVRTCYNAL